jgi:hypothetical protein
MPNDRYEDEACLREPAREGIPADLVKEKSTLTGKHLSAFVGSRPKAAQ